MMAAEEYLTVFQDAKRSGNTHRGNGAYRFADRQTHQGEPSGSERVNTLSLNSGVPTSFAIERHFAPAKQCRHCVVIPSKYFFATLPRVLVRCAQAAFGSPTSSRQSVVSSRNGLNAIKSAIPLGKMWLASRR